MLLPWVTPWWGVGVIRLTSAGAIPNWGEDWCQVTLTLLGIFYISVFTSFQTLFQNCQIHFFFVVIKAKTKCYFSSFCIFFFFFFCGCCWCFCCFHFVCFVICIDFIIIGFAFIYFFFLGFDGLYFSSFSFCCCSCFFFFLFWCI